MLGGEAAAGVALITGVTGQDGTLLARRLVGEGLEVHGLAHTRPDLDDWQAREESPVHLHAVDITDVDAMDALLRDVAPHEVYNLAGISSVAYSWQEPVLTGEVTGLGAVTVFEAARRLRDDHGVDVRVVQASSAEIFGIPDRAPQDEATSVRPVSPYGAAKAYAHLMARVYRARGLRIASAILYNHESPLRPVEFVTRKITAGVARIATEGAGAITLGALDARRDWGWAPDYVDAMVRAARHDEPDDFVVATGETHSVAEFVAAAFRCVGIDDWQAHVVSDPGMVRPIEAAEVVGDPRKARRVLGWSPTVTFDELVRRMVESDVRQLEERR